MIINVEKIYKKMALELRENQKRAIQVSIENDFESGVHFHATGTGKSHISLQIAIEYHKRYPNNNIMWICEQKTILKQHFSKKKLRENNYQKTMEHFFFLDFSQRKKSNWYEIVNACKSWWKKPYFCVINRAFLTSKKRYEKIKNPVHLIIHDECHSAINKTSSDFYEYIIKTFRTKCIGLSATPAFQFDMKPFDKILSSYNIYEACMDNVIVKPKIDWLSVEGETSSDVSKEKIIFQVIRKRIQEMRFKKIIVWCGMIEHCVITAKKFKKEFPDFSFHIDVSKHTVNENIEFQDYNSFVKRNDSGFLFCASKHREG